MTGSLFLLRRHQFVVERAQPFRDGARPGDHRHEIRVAAPARHNVKMQMIDNACAGSLAEVKPDIEPLRFHRCAEQSLGVDHQIPKLDDFIFSEAGQLGRLAVGNRHQMTHCVRVAIHHEKCSLAPCDHQVFGVVAGRSCAGQKIAIPRFFREVFDPPRTPQSFNFLFGKFRHVTRHLNMNERRWETRKVEGALHRYIVTWLHGYIVNGMDES